MGRNESNPFFTIPIAVSLPTMIVIFLLRSKMRIRENRFHFSGLFVWLFVLEVIKQHGINLIELHLRRRSPLKSLPLDLQLDHSMMCVCKSRVIHCYVTTSNSPTTFTFHILVHLSTQSKQK